MDESGGHHDLLQHQLHQKQQHHPINAFHVNPNGGPYRNFPPSSPLDAAGAAKRAGFPPTSPYSQFPPVAGARAPALFSLDGSQNPLSDDMTMDDGAGKNGLPPRRSHRRSQSDIPLAFLQSSPAIAAATGVRLPFFNSGKGAAQGVKMEGSWERGGLEVNGDDLFNAYMNLDGLDALNSSEENREELNSRDSGSKTNGGGDSSDNEVESNGNIGGRIGIWNGGENGGPKSGPVAGPRHSRSLSMDSFMGKLNFGEGSQKGMAPVGPNSFSLEFGNGEFTAAEMKKIMANEKLVELAMTDPKRVKRILANRQSAARSKERKMRYIAELEHKVQALQTEATTLSAQLTLLQRDSSGLATQNNELKFRIQAMEQQAQLRDALNEALTAEVQRLKLAAAGHGDSHPSNNMNQQTSITSHLFQMQQKQQAAHISLYHLQQQNEDEDESSEQ